MCDAAKGCQQPTVADNVTCGDGVCKSGVCTCPAGSTGSGVKCVDINECLLDNGGCDSNAQCSNTTGSFSCACKSGFTGNGKTCQDVDECANGTAGCWANAGCTNLSGSFSCKCNTGYINNGSACVTQCGDGVKAGAEQCDDGNTKDGDGCSGQCKAESGCIDTGGDKLILVAELNACLKFKGAAFFNVQYIEVAYGHTDYLDNVCQAMGYSGYSTTYGGDKCSTDAKMYPSHCAQGWLGNQCSNGCGNVNYDGFYCK